jgi:hypothetical protein
MSMPVHTTAIEQQEKGPPPRGTAAQERGTGGDGGVNGYRDEVPNSGFKMALTDRPSSNSGATEFH